MTETQILEELISFYESRGVDMHRILSDPIFAHMPLQSKVETIKTYAGRMAQGTPSGYSSRDKRNIGWSALAGAGTGAIAGFKAGRLGAGKFIGGESHVALPVFAAIAGALVGAGVAGNKYLERVQERRSLKDALETASKEKTDSSAFRALALNNLVASKYDRSDVYDVLGAFKPMDMVVGGISDKYPGLIEEHNEFLGKARKQLIKQESH